MQIIKRLTSQDGISQKFLQETADGNTIETGYYDLDERIICISSQIGCMMGCVFCATSLPLKAKGGGPFVRNLTASEIIQQVKNVLAAVPSNEPKKKILFSFMGMGEPLLNYKNVVKSIKLLEQQFPHSRTTIATTGVNCDLIKKLAHERFSATVKLHLSLHAPNDTLRKRIMPHVQTIKPSLEALRYYAKLKHTTPKVNYLPIRGLNASKAHATELAKLLRGYPFIVKLSLLNRMKTLRPSNNKTFLVFEKILHAQGLKTCRFVSNGPDIQVGCGQLRRRVVLR